MLRGEALYQLDRYSEGAEAARRGLELEPEDMALLDVLALNLIELGDLAGAEQALLSALELWPDNETLLCHYALACARGGQATKASQLVDRAARLDPTSTDVLRARAQVAYAERRQEARQAVRGRAARRRAGGPDRPCAARQRPRRGQHLRRGASLRRGGAARPDRPRHRACRPAQPRADALAPVADLPDPALRPDQGLGRVPRPCLLLVAATGQTTLFVPLVALYLFLVVYSWTVAPLARWWMHGGPAERGPDRRAPAGDRGRAREHGTAAAARRDAVRRRAGRKRRPTSTTALFDAGVAPRRRAARRRNRRGAARPSGRASDYADRAAAAGIDGVAELRAKIDARSASTGHCGSSGAGPTTTGMRR